MDEEIKEVSPEETPKELTDEEKKQIMDFYETMLKDRIRTHLSKIYRYLVNHSLTVKEAIDEVQNKSSGLPRAAREILLEVKLEILEKWFSEYLNEKKINENCSISN